MNFIFKMQLFQQIQWIGGIHMTMAKRVWLTYRYIQIKYLHFSQKLSKSHYFE